MKKLFFLTFISIFFTFLEGHSYLEDQGALVHFDFITDLSFDSPISNADQVVFQQRSINELLHSDNIRATFSTYNTTFYLHLFPNTNLLHSDAQITYASSDGSHTQHKLDPSEFLIFKGDVVSKEHSPVRLLEQKVGLLEHHYSTSTKGWARIVLDPSRNTLHGSFSYENQVYRIVPIDMYLASKNKEDIDIPNPKDRHPHHEKANMIVYRDVDIVVSDPKAPGNQAMCSTKDLFNRITSPLYQVSNPGQLWKRQLNQIMPDFSLVKRNANDNTAGCPTTRQILYMGAAADCTFINKHGGADNSRRRILSIWNQVSELYERTFNISLGLIHIFIAPEICSTNSSISWNRDCHTSYGIDERLSDFSEWRGSRGDDGAGLWHLVTSCASGSRVGVAWVRQLCVTGSDSQRGMEGGITFTSGTGVSSATREEWKVVAHEIGHNFGAIHDCTSSDCPCSGQCGCCPCEGSCDCQGQYLMNPSSTSATSFSPCSIRDICSSIPTLGSCLQDPGARRTLGDGMCGNGIVENGEDCDCGLDEECQNDPCCDAQTCRFKDGAVCADSNSLCCEDCQLRQQGYVCRPSRSECDIEEICSGNSAECPTDDFKEDGTTCGNEEGLKCASGQCTSRDEQCRIRGSVLGITEHCPATFVDDCQMTCADPRIPNVCITLTGDFIDGTECGWNSKCREGSCRGDNLFYTVLLWARRYLYFSIPIGIAILLILVTCLWSCCTFCCRRARLRRAKTVIPVPSRTPTYNAHSDFVDPTPYNGAYLRQDSYSQIPLNHLGDPHRR